MYASIPLADRIPEDRVKKKLAKATGRAQNHCHCARHMAAVSGIGRDEVPWVLIVSLEVFPYCRPDKETGNKEAERSEFPLFYFRCPWAQCADEGVRAIGKKNLHGAILTSSDGVLVILDGVSVGCGESGGHCESEKRGVREM